MLRLIRCVKMGQSSGKSHVCLGFLPAGALQNRHRTLRDPGSSFRVGRQLERKGLRRHYSVAHGVSIRGLEVKQIPQGRGRSSSYNWKSGEGEGARMGSVVCES